MNLKTQYRDESRKHHFLIKTALILFIFSLLSGCHFPQAEEVSPTLNPRQQTEISGILNPHGMETGESTPTEAFSTPVPTATMAAEAPRIDGYTDYLTQQGDTLSALAKRFNVPEDVIFSSISLTTDGLLPVGLSLQIPDSLEAHLPFDKPILPDSEVIYGPSVGNFDIIDYIYSAGGFLAGYEEEVKGQTYSGPEIVRLVSLETSTNPRLLLAFLEYQSGWVFGFPPGAEQDICRDGQIILCC